MRAADQFQHQVQRRQRAAGGDAFSVDDETLAHHRHLWIGGGEILEILPMGGGREIVEEARLRQQPGAGFDAGHHLAVPRRLRQEHLELRGGAELPVVAGKHEERRRFALRTEGAGHRNGKPLFVSIALPSGLNRLQL